MMATQIQPFPLMHETSPNHRFQLSQQPQQPQESMYQQQQQQRQCQSTGTPLHQVNVDGNSFDVDNLCVPNDRLDRQQQWQGQSSSNHSSSNNHHRSSSMSISQDIDFLYFEQHLRDCSPSQLQSLCHDDEQNWRQTFRSYPTIDDLPACINVDDIFAKLAPDSSFNLNTNATFNTSTNTFNTNSNNSCNSYNNSKTLPRQTSGSSNGAGERRRVTIRRRPGAGSRLAPSLNKRTTFHNSVCTNNTSITNTTGTSNSTSSGINVSLNTSSSMNNISSNNNNNSNPAAPVLTPTSSTSSSSSTSKPNPLLSNPRPGAVFVQQRDYGRSFDKPKSSDDLFKSKGGLVRSTSTHSRQSTSNNSTSKGHGNGRNGMDDARSCVSSNSGHHSCQVTVATAPAALRNKDVERTMVEVMPGEFVPLRGSIETWEAVMRGSIMKTRCSCCLLELCCIQDADLIMCPGCRIISPIAKTRGTPNSHSGGGLGLGMTVQEAKLELQRRGLSSTQL